MLGCAEFRMRARPRGGYWFFFEFAAVARRAGVERENIVSRFASKILIQSKI